VGLRAAGGPAVKVGRWLISSRESTNFTYDLTARNRQYLAAMIAYVCAVPHQAILGYIDELEQDRELQAHIRTATLASQRAFSADPVARYGRRLGWYALARALKPKLIVETGGDKGLGSCVLTAALRRNAAEGAPGYYYGTDINPQAGYLLSGAYKAHGEILYGDSIQSLQRIAKPIDLFINDSDHSAAYEAQEYLTVAAKLGKQAIVLGDNAHASEELFKFATASGRRFLFFQEQPADHWYPGGGIGIAFWDDRPAEATRNASATALERA
jgi:predicted O-methyltransferase YrrM